MVPVRREPTPPERRRSVRLFLTVEGLSGSNKRVRGNINRRWADRASCGTL